MPLWELCILIAVNSFSAILLFGVRVWRRERVWTWLSALDEIPFFLWVAGRSTGTVTLWTLSGDPNPALALAISSEWMILSVASLAFIGVLTWMGRSLEQGSMCRGFKLHWTTTVVIVTAFLDHLAVIGTYATYSFFMEVPR